jgi:hypothetical protein
MFIIPYYFVKDEVQSKTEFKLWKAYVFLTGGEIWESLESLESLKTCKGKKKTPASQIVDSYLTPNGFVGRVTLVTKTALYYEVDQEKTNLKNFYYWTDSHENAEDVFRPFTWLGDTRPGQEDDWGWSEECNSLLLGKFGTATDLWKGLEHSLRESRA